MNKIPTEIAQNINHLLGVRGVPYRRFVDGKWITTDCYCWHRPQSEESVEPQLEIPEELTKAINRVSKQVYAEMTGIDEFDIDVYAARMQALIQEEDDEIKAMLEKIRPELEEISNVPLQKKFQWRKRLENVRELLLGKPYFPYGDIIVAGTKNQFDVLRNEETTGNNYSIGTEEIITSLSKIDGQYGIMILSAGFDFVRFEVERPPHGDQAISLGEVLFEMCPDLYEAPKDFSDAIVELWWD